MADWDREFPSPPASPGAAASAPAAPGRYAFADPDRAVIDLLHPLVDAETGARIERIEVRRLTAREMIALVEAADAPADDVELTRRVVAAMAGVSAELLGALSSDDAGRVAAAALPFMPAGLVLSIERIAPTDAAAPDEAA